MRTVKQFFSPPPLNTEQICVNGIGIQESMRPGIVNRPGGTGDYLLMFFYDTVIIRSAAGIQQARPKSLMVWTPDLGHYYGWPHADWLHSWIHCSGPFVGMMLERNHIPVYTPVSLPDPSIVEKYLFSIYQEVTGYIAPDEIIVQHALDSWMREVHRASKGGTPCRTVPAQYLELKRHLGMRLHESFSLTDLADRMHVSAPYLCNRFKYYFGESVMSCLMRLRMEQALYLLRDENLSVTEVAHMAGYHDIYRFSKQFKRYYRISPRDMRRALQNKER
ncbi:MAG: helix-turn-helix domain-containing protein [Bacillota bacterium]